MSWLCRIRASSRDLLRWLKCWDQVRTGICCNVEDGVDHEREESKRHLASEQPDKCHTYENEVLDSCS